MSILRQQSSSFTIESVAADAKVSFPVAHDTNSLSKNVGPESVESPSASDAVTDGNIRVVRPPFIISVEINKVPGTKTDDKRVQHQQHEGCRPRRRSALFSVGITSLFIIGRNISSSISSSQSKNTVQHLLLLVVVIGERLRSYHKTQLRQHQHQLLNFHEQSLAASTDIHLIRWISSSLASLPTAQQQQQYPRLRAKPAATESGIIIERTSCFSIRSSFSSTNFSKEYRED
jgi:hypothetical protein